jgi:YgiT-type zinc finger domain-containing protein
MRQGLAPFHVDRRGYHLSLDAVPAWICSQCGEPYFDEREVAAIQRLVGELDQQAAELVQAAQSYDTIGRACH